MHLAVYLKYVKLTIFSASTMYCICPPRDFKPLTENAWKTAKTLLSIHAMLLPEFFDSLEALRRASARKFKNIHEIGPRIADMFSTYLYSAKYSVYLIEVRLETEESKKT